MFSSCLSLPLYISFLPSTYTVEESTCKEKITTLVNGTKGKGRVYEERGKGNKQEVMPRSHIGNNRRVSGP